MTKYRSSHPPSPALERLLGVCATLRSDARRRMVRFAGLGRALGIVGRCCKRGGDGVRARVNERPSRDPQEKAGLVPSQDAREPDLQQAAALRLLRQRLEGPVREVLQESVRDPFVRIWCRWVRLVRRSEPFDALLDDLLAPLSRGTDSLTPSDAPLDAPPDSRNDTDGRSSPNAGRSALDRVRAGLARFCAGVSLELRCRVVHRFLGDDVIHRFLDENGRPHDGSRLGPMLAQRPRSDAEVRLWTRAVELIEGMVTLRSDPPSAAPTEHPSDPRSAPTRAAYRPELMPRTLDPD